MYVSRFPCRACGQSTEGEDTYVVCSRCLAELEPPSGQYAQEQETWHRSPPGGAMHVPLAPDEVEARVKKLLDGW